MDGYNIYLRQDGRWEGRISQGKKENGKRKFLYIFWKKVGKQLETKLMN